MGSRSGRSEGDAPAEVPWKLLQAGLRTKMTESEITLSPSCARSAAHGVDFARCRQSAGGSLTMTRQVQLTPNAGS